MSIQTPRPLADLLTRLPDNTAGLIEAEQVRDAVVSLAPSRGALEWTGAPMTTTFTAANIYRPMQASTVLDATVCTTCVSMPSAGELQWLKAFEQVLLANATLAVLPAGNNKQYTFTFAINGVAVPALSVSQFFGNLSGRPAGVFLSGLIRIQPNDRLSVVVRADTDTTALSTSGLTLSGVGFLP